MNDDFTQLSRGLTGKRLLKLLEGVKQEVADIRTPIKARAEIANEVRFGIIEAIDLLIISRLKVAAGEISPPNPNEHE